MRKRQRMQQKKHRSAFEIYIFSLHKWYSICLLSSIITLVYSLRYACVCASKQTQFFIVIHNNTSIWFFSSHIHLVEQLTLILNFTVHIGNYMTICISLSMSPNIIQSGCIGFCFKILQNKNLHHSHCSILFSIRINIILNYRCDFFHTFVTFALYMALFRKSTYIFCYL